MLEKIKNNLEQTIADKTALMEQYERYIDIVGSDVEKLVYKTSAEFLRINLDELEAILNDIEECINENT